jgi:hypothetical protein
MAILDQSQVAGSTLGYASIASNFTTTSATAVQITGLTVTVTIPSGGRKVRITAFARDLNGSTSAYEVLSIWDGTVGSGTQLAAGQAYIAANNLGEQAVASAIVTPAAGSKTYNVGLQTTAGTASTEAASTYPAYILVELI